METTTLSPATIRRRLTHELAPHRNPKSLLLSLNFAFNAAESAVRDLPLYEVVGPLFERVKQAIQDGLPDKAAVEADLRPLLLGTVEGVAEDDIPILRRLYAALNPTSPVLAPHAAHDLVVWLYRDDPEELARQLQFQYRVLDILQMAFA